MNENCQITLGFAVFLQQNIALLCNRLALAENYKLHKDKQKKKKNLEIHDNYKFLSSKSLRIGAAAITCKKIDSETSVA